MQQSGDKILQKVFKNGLIAILLTLEYAIVLHIA